MRKQRRAISPGDQKTEERKASMNNPAIKMKILL
jgi:hypothetical protein